MSFYQTNSVQTEKLYNLAIGLADLNKTDVIFDLYCGIGTIGLCASKYVKKVYGIEVVNDAIKDAEFNAKLNNIDNSEFFTGEVENILPELIETKNIKADVVFVDPPRKGCDIKTIETLKHVSPKKIVYVSCNPSTLARDLRLLDDMYEIKELYAVDMFPFTKHVECVALICKKEGL
jgi:23S rRNA (uracil1939-C5)-methyltransferase